MPLGQSDCICKGRNTEPMKNIRCMGFLSSMEIPLHDWNWIKHKIDSALLIWPDNTYQRIDI